MSAYADGYAAGLAAARDAVAAWFVSNRDEMTWPDAQAAIDALTTHDSSDTGTKVPGSLAGSQQSAYCGDCDHPSLAEQIAHAESCDG